MRTTLARTALIFTGSAVQEVTYELSEAPVPQTIPLERSHISGRLGAGAAGVFLCCRSRGFDGARSCRLEPSRLAGSGGNQHREFSVRKTAFHSCARGHGR